MVACFFFSSRRRHTRCSRDWSSDVCSSDLVPLGHDRDASRPATDRDLAVPAGEIAADPGEALTAARIAEPAHTLDQRGLESGRVPPARSEALALRRLEGVAEPYPCVRHRDHDHPLRELAAPVVRLHRHPAAGARVLYNILTRL